MGILAAPLSRLAAAALGVSLLSIPGCQHRPPSPPVVIYEDGSGIQYEGDQEVRTFPEGTFVWDCTRMGNRRCGAK